MPPGNASGRRGPHKVTADRSAGVAPPSAAREVSTADAARRKPRELYDADAPASPASPDDAPRNTPFRGEFEQRTRGPKDAGQAGRFGSGASLPEQFNQRIAEDPRLAGTQVDVVIDAQALTLSGEIADPAVRDRFLEHARALGIEEIHDSLRLVMTRTPDNP